MAFKNLNSEALDGTFYSGLTLSVGAEGGSDDIDVTISADQNIGVPHLLPKLVVYTAEAADGLVLEVPSGGISDGGEGTVTALLTDASMAVVELSTAGRAVVTVTQSGSDTLYLIVVRPDTGAILASGALTFAA